MSRNAPGTHNDAHGASIRDFVYNLRKLKKCLHLYLAETADRGIGVFAAREFSRGGVIMMDFDGDYYDQVLSYQELSSRGIDLKYPLQVGHDRFRVPCGNIDDFVNHSCEPTAGVRLYPSGMIILAIQPIKVHEEITLDYATYLNNSYEQMICRCGSANCRGIIGNFSMLPADLQQHYLELGIVGDFVLEAGSVEDTSP
jgi:SET domain